MTFHIFINNRSKLLFRIHKKVKMKILHTMLKFAKKENIHIHYNESRFAIALKIFLNVT